MNLIQLKQKRRRKTSFERLISPKLTETQRAIRLKKTMNQYDKSPVQNEYMFVDKHIMREIQDIDIEHVQKQAPSKKNQNRHLLAVKRIQSIDDLYEGQVNMLTGKKEGYGRLSMDYGGSFTGEWLNDQLHGFAIYTDPTGMRYEGIYKQGCMQGCGIMVHSTGEIYDGIFNYGQKIFFSVVYLQNRGPYVQSFTKNIRVNSDYPYLRNSLTHDEDGNQIEQQPN